VVHAWEATLEKMKPEVGDLIDSVEERKNPIKDIVNDFPNLNVTFSDLNGKTMHVFKTFLDKYKERGGGGDESGVVGLGTFLEYHISNWDVRLQIARTIQASAYELMQRFDDMGQKSEEQFLRDFAVEFRFIVEKMKLGEWLKRVDLNKRNEASRSREG
jgi:hypothetical protein